MNPQRKGTLCRQLSGNYLVMLKDEADLLSFKHSLHSTSPEIHSKIKSEWSVLKAKGVAGPFDETDRSILSQHLDVKLIHKEGLITTAVRHQQYDAPWGLQRVSSDAANIARQWDDLEEPNALNYTYTYEDAAGQPVDIYILDSGVHIAHEDFEDRASWPAAANFVETEDPRDNRDLNGHGTHCAGTAAGRRFGVAKQANIIAVKVIDEHGGGDDLYIINGLAWIFGNVGVLNPAARRSVVSISLRCCDENGQSHINPVVDHIIRQLTNVGIHVVVAAGNQALDAGGFSPARSPGAITVGACTIANRRAYFSNYGAVVDLFAPGVCVTSVRTNTLDEYTVMSGTSMACPHVSGVVANLLRLEDNMNVLEMRANLVNLSRDGAVNLAADDTDDVDDYAGTTTRMVCHPPPPATAATVAATATAAANAARASVVAARAAALAAETAAAIAIATERDAVAVAAAAD